MAFRFKTIATTRMKGLKGVGLGAISSGSKLVLSVAMSRMKVHIAQNPALVHEVQDDNFNKLTLAESDQKEFPAFQYVASIGYSCIDLLTFTALRDGTYQKHRRLWRND